LQRQTLLLADSGAAQLFARGPATEYPPDRAPRRRMMSAVGSRWAARLAGRDPYDALMSGRIPPFVRGTKSGRQLVIQLGRKLPIDLGPLLGISPFVMAKTAACFLSAAARQAPSQERDGDIDALAKLLYGTRGCLGHGRWGYEFDVQTRWAFYPAGSPNTIVTAFASRALAEAGLATGRADLLDGAIESAESIASSLLDTSGEPFVRYTLASERLVHNANLLGAACLAFAGSLANRQRLVDAGLAACMASIRRQRQNGSWPYGEGPGVAWEDNFHTAYDLDGLLTLWLATSDPEVRSALEKGATHWSGSFFGSQGEPWYEPHRRLPYDAHSAGTALDVGSRLARHGLCDTALMRLVADWTARRLVDPSSGRMHARVGRCFTDRRHFVRWADAHYALGCSSLAVLNEGRRLPYEDALRTHTGQAPSGGM
jgi:hypothetical protein